jgi:hypothetical protein
LSLVPYEDNENFVTERYYSVMKFCIVTSKMSWIRVFLLVRRQHDKQLGTWSLLRVTRFGCDFTIVLQLASRQLKPQNLVPATLAPIRFWHTLVPSLIASSCHLKLAFTMCFMLLSSSRLLALLLLDCRCLYYPWFMVGWFLSLSGLCLLICFVVFGSCWCSGRVILLRVQLG